MQISFWKTRETPHPFGLSTPTAFWLLFFLLVILRLTTLLTAVEHTSYDEEMVRGTIAKEISEGIKLPLWEYQADNYSGGSIVIGFIAAFFFKILGPSLFALKLAPFLFHLGSFALLFFLMRRFFNPRTAIATCLLYILSPPAFTSSSLLAMGFHTESIFFSLLNLICFYRLRFEEKNRNLWIILFGFSAGIGFWFTHITILTPLACLMSVGLTGRFLINKKNILLCFSAFLLGMIPWIAFNLTHHAQGMTYLRDVFFSSDSSLKGFDWAWDRAKKSALISGYGIPAAFNFFPEQSRINWLLGFFYSSLIISLMIPFIKKHLLSKGVPHSVVVKRIFPILIYIPLFCFIYTLSDYTISQGHSFFYSRYFIPLQLMLWIVLGVALDHFKHWKYLLTLLLLIGAASQSRVIAREPFARALRYKGYSYCIMGNRLRESVYTLPQEFKRFNSFAINYPPEDQRFIYWGATVLAIPPMARGDSNALKNLIQTIQKNVPHPYQKYFFENLDIPFTCSQEDTKKLISLVSESVPELEQSFLYKRYLEQNMGDDLSNLSEVFNVCLPQIPTPSQRWFYVNLGLSLVGQSPETKGYQDALRLFDQISGENRLWIIRGIGIAASSQITYAQDLRIKLDKLPVKIDDRFLDDFYWGVGWGVRSFFGEDAARSYDWIADHVPNGQPSAWKGAKDWKNYYLKP